jgi:hypothetical protein
VTRIQVKAKHVAETLLKQHLSQVGEETQKEVIHKEFAYTELEIIATLAQPVEAT